MGPARRREAGPPGRSDRCRAAPLVAELGPARRRAGEARTGHVGISGRRLPRVGCARSRARGCSFADLGLASLTCLASRRTICAASHMGIATACSRSLPKLERTHTGVASRYARAFMGRASTICTPFSTAAASCCPRSSRMGRAIRAGSRAG
jgi:hypothetical protein